MRIITAVVTIALLASCGSNPVNGELAKACIAADRRAANPQLCTCVQRAADRTLNSSDQALAATFFEDPQRAQDIRQQGTRSTSAFWARYSEFANVARATCG